MPESRRRDRARGRTPELDPAKPSERTRPDACPGAWRRHDAADGALARFRLVGGAVTAPELMVLAGASVEGGSPLELTSRGSLQVRGLAASSADDLADALRGMAGDPTAVLDDRGRDLPCSLVASPRSGTLDAVAGRVATGLRGRIEVPGRFLVALDDGSGDVAGLGADVTVTGSSHGWALLLDGADTGLRHADPAVVTLAAVEAFGAVRDGRWRLAELPDGAATVAAAVRERLDVSRHDPTVAPPPPRRPQPGVGDDGVLEVLPPLGELDLTAVSALVEALGTGGALRVTPWRTLVLRGLADPAGTAATLGTAGLAVDPDTRWAGLSACVGAPRCAKSHADVRADLAAAVRDGRAGGDIVPAHWVGCERACGTPGGRVVVVEATGGASYRTVVRAGRVAR